MVRLEMYHLGQEKTKWYSSRNRLNKLIQIYAYLGLDEFEACVLDCSDEFHIKFKIGIPRTSSEINTRFYM